VAAEEAAAASRHRDAPAHPRTRVARRAGVRAVAPESARWRRSPRGGAGVAPVRGVRAAASGPRVRPRRRCAISPFLPSRLSAQCRGRRPYVAREPVRAAVALSRVGRDRDSTSAGSGQARRSPKPASLDLRKPIPSLEDLAGISLRRPGRHPVESGRRALAPRGHTARSSEPSDAASVLPSAAPPIRAKLASWVLSTRWNNSLS
jgi:hypothetical protein